METNFLPKISLLSLCIIGVLGIVYHYTAKSDNLPPQHNTKSSKQIKNQQEKPITIDSTILPTTIQQKIKDITNNTRKCNFSILAEQNAVAFLKTTIREVPGIQPYSIRQAIKDTLQQNKGTKELHVFISTGQTDDLGLSQKTFTYIESLGKVTIKAQKRTQYEGYRGKTSTIQLANEKKH